MKKYFTLICTLLTTFASAQWQELTPDTEFWHERMFFHSSTKGMVAGLDGIYQRTYDGGVTWDTAYIIDADYSLNPSMVYHHDIRSIDFPSDSIGYFGGEDGFYFKTLDGGSNWVYWGHMNTLDHIFDVKFFNNDTGVAESGHYALWRTTDGGTTWNLVSTVHQPYRFEKINDSTMLLCGRGVFRSQDYGATWQRMNCDSTLYLVDINMGDSLNGIAAGGNGVLVRTIDGGYNWSTPVTVSSKTIWAVEMLNDTFGFISAGDDWTNNWQQPDISFVMYTLDGGNTWSQPDTIGSKTIIDLEFPEDSLGFACGWLGNLLHNEHPLVPISGVGFQEYQVIHTEVYPNPATDVVYVSLPGRASNSKATISITDVSGRIVKPEQTLFVAPYEVDLAFLPSGVYFLHCTVNEVESVAKFIVH